jgi:hypothetical protein
VQAAGGARIRWDGRQFDVTGPEVVAFEEAGGAFNPAQRAIMRGFGSRFVRVRDV